ncbi:b(0,+)-type amino acid transporter 1-like [Macrosteles quadrilineatus]|uniref:b(0,+)-type amino acid transporter 1-like n=1 Tax=Macrosteles quadrilineatus TaxID=74068 RepID=UPI0023E0CFC9|nr:b(0,+)-type amino acid transporter 1-like [Macrosteles quadrilineatus]
MENKKDKSQNNRSPRRTQDENEASGSLNNQKPTNSQRPPRSQDDEKPSRSPRPIRSQEDEKPSRSPRPIRSQEDEKSSRPPRPLRSQEDENPSRSQRPLSLQEDEKPSRPPRPLRSQEDENPSRSQRPLRSQEDEKPSRPPRPLRSQDENPSRSQRPLRSQEDEKPSRSPRPLRSQDDVKPSGSQRPLRSLEDNKPSRSSRPLRSKDDEKPSSSQRPLRLQEDQNQNRSPRPLRSQENQKPDRPERPQRLQDYQKSSNSTNIGIQDTRRPKKFSKVSFPDEPKLKQTHQLTPIQKSSQNLQTSQEPEQEGFFVRLLPDIARKEWAAITARFLSGDNTDKTIPKEIFLKREMGLFGAVNFLITISVGTGIFTNPPVLLERTGSTTEALLVWLFCGFFSLLIAITYGELVFLVSQSGEKFSYLLAAFSPINKVFGPLPAFLSMWMETLFTGPAQVSLMALLFAEHLYSPISSSLNTYTNIDVTEPYHLKQIIGVTVLVLITCVNFQSIRTCVMVQNLFGVVKMLICLAVIVGGLHGLSSGNVHSFDYLFNDWKGNSTGLLKAVYRGMWTYEGWSTVVIISEEVIDPLRTIPAAIIIGVPIVTFLYLAMNVSFLCLLTASEIKAAPTRFYFIFGERLFGPGSMVMPTFFAISALSSSMGIQLGMSRSCFAGGREGHTLEVLSYIHVRRFVPIPAVLAQALISLVFIVYIPAIDMIEYASFIIWSFYGLSFVALIILRATEPNTYRLYKTPLFIPIILTVLSILVTLDPLLRADGGAGLIFAFIYMCVGVIVYFQFVYRHKRIRFMDLFNDFIRSHLNVAPPTALPEGYSHSGSSQNKFSIADKLVDRERYSNS